MFSQVCAPGTNPGDSGSSCEPCSTGRYSPSGFRCVKCPAGTQQSYDQTKCDSCKLFGPTFSAHGYKCISCPAGTEPEPATRGTCDVCAAGKASPSGRGCDPCGPGTWTPARASKCLDCAVGKYDHNRDASTPCATCAAGKYSMGGALRCTDCPAGRADQDRNSSTACAACGVGRYSASGSTNCTIMGCEPQLLLYITGRNAAQRWFHPTRKPSTDWFKVSPAMTLSPAVPFSTRVSAG